MPNTGRSPCPKPPPNKILITLAVAVVASIIFIISTPYLMGELKLPVMQQDSNKSLNVMPPQSNPGESTDGSAGKKNQFVPLPDALKGKHKIVALGDSITQFGGQREGYVWLMQRYLDAIYPEQKSKILNAGISGHKSTDMQARFQRDVLNQKPDLVTINVGVNDVWHAFLDFKARKTYPNGDLPAGVQLPLYREKLTEMVRAAQSAGISVVLLSPTLIYENLDSPENARLAQYVAAMREIAAQNNCLFIDINIPFRDVIAAYQQHAGKTQNLLTTDGVHLNAAGNRVMAYTILQGLGVPEKEIQNLRVEDSPVAQIDRIRLGTWLRRQ